MKLNALNFILYIHLLFVKVLSNINDSKIKTQAILDTIANSESVELNIHYYGCVDEEKSCKSLFKPSSCEKRCKCRGFIKCPCKEKTLEELTPDEILGKINYIPFEEASESKKVYNRTEINRKKAEEFLKTRCECCCCKETPVVLVEPPTYIEPEYEEKVPLRPSNKPPMDFSVIPLAKPFLKKPKRDLTLRTDIQNPAAFLKSMKEGESYEHSDELSTMKAIRTKGGYRVTTYLNSQSVGKLIGSQESPMTTSKFEGIDDEKKDDIDRSELTIAALHHSTGADRNNLFQTYKNTD